MHQTRLLARTFFARMFESDLMPEGLPQVQLILWGSLLAATPTTGYPLLLRRDASDADREVERIAGQEWRVEHAPRERIRIDAEESQAGRG